HALVDGAGVADAAERAAGPDRVAGVGPRVAVGLPQAPAAAGVDRRDVLPARRPPRLGRLPGELPLHGPDAVVRLAAGPARRRAAPCSRRWRWTDSSSSPTTRPSSATTSFSPRRGR